MLKQHLLLGGTLISFFFMLLETLTIALLNKLVPLAFELKIIDTDQTFQYWATSIGGITIITTIIFMFFVVIDVMEINKK